MKKPTSLKLVAATVPILVFGLGGVMAGAIAAEHEMDSKDHEVMEERDADGHDRDAMEQRRADDRGDAPHIERMPELGLHASDLMDKKIHNRENDDEIGEINDLVIDQDGRIVAVVIVSGSGVLGIGGKNVAIAWDRIERTTEDDEVKLYIDMNEDTLQEAPEYERD